VREKLTLRGKRTTITLRLEDTAGLRNTENPIEKMGIERTLQACRDADMILFIVDPLSSRESAQQQWNALSQAKIPSLTEKTLGILTKSDQLSQDELDESAHRVRKLEITTWAATSALTGAGIAEAIDTMTHFCENWTCRDRGEILLTRVDHHNAVTAALENLERAKQAAELELFAADIRQALHSLSPLIGETLPDDILGKIFSDFCIGK